jgi:hypothetical protein
MKITVLLSSLLLTACANNTIWYNPPDQSMDFVDLNYFKWDCEHAPDQYAMLKYQLKNTTPFPVDYERRAVIYKNMNEIETACGTPAPKPARCVHVREDMPQGTGQATVCNTGRGLAPLERPMVNRWEAIVDSK